MGVKPDQYVYFLRAHSHSQMCIRDRMTVEMGEQAAIMPALPRMRKRATP